MSFFATKFGQAVILAAVILACWYGFSRYYKQVGIAECEAEHAAATADANQELYDAQNERDEKSRGVTEKTDAAAREQVKAIDTVTADAKEVVKYVYRDVVRTVSTSCVHPVDPRVQAQIDNAVRSINTQE